jgi:hypothetical protein
MAKQISRSKTRATRKSPAEGVVAAFGGILRLAEELTQRLPMLTSVWNDVLLGRARADLERAERLLDMPAECTVLSGFQTKALAAGFEEFGCDAIVLPAPRYRRLARVLHQ